MKYIVLLAAILFSFASNAQKVTINEIDLKGTKIGSNAGFLGKSGENYVFSSSNPVSAFGNNFFKTDPPKLFLIDKQLKLKQTSDLKEQLKDAGLKDVVYEDLVFFNDKMYVVASEYFKKEKIQKYYLYTLDNKTLKINFAKNLPLGETKKWTVVGGNVIIGSSILYSVSEDKTKLAFTLVSDASWYALDESNVMRVTNLVLDKDLKTLCTNNFIDDEFKDNKKTMNSSFVYNQQVTNDGSIYLLIKAFVKKVSSNETHSTKLYFVDNKCGGKKIDMKLPSEVYVPSGAKINANNYGSIVTGFPSIYEKSQYKIFGYINQTMDNQGNVLGLNVMPFEKFFMDNVKEGNGLLKNSDIIQYDATVLVDDGSFYMVSQISRKDIIVSYMNKSGKAIWVKSINRKNVSSAKVEAVYKKETKELFLVYEDNIDGTGMYFTKIDIDGKMTASTELISDTRLFANYKTPLENELVLSELSKNKITFAVIQF